MSEGNWYSERIQREFGYQQDIKDVARDGFAVGSVKGVRVWRLTGRNHQLRSVAFDYKWRAGVNQATCLRTEMDYLHAVGNPHRPAAIDCCCGFYAYYKNSSRYPHLGHTDVNTVEGIIEGWGKTTIGHLGFRCEKAKVVALVAPDPKPVDKDRWKDEAWLTRWALRIGRSRAEHSAFMPIIPCIGMSFGGCFGVYALTATFGVSWWFAPVVVALIAVCALSGLWLKAHWRAMEIYRWTTIHPEWEYLRRHVDQGFTSEVAEAMFPGVRCYPTLEAMLEHEELSDPPKESRNRYKDF